MDTDERLLAERAKIDPEAFGELYDRHVRTVYRLALSMLHNPAQAEDVTAEVFLKALRGIGGYRYQGRPFNCWLYQIARNTIANEFRGRLMVPLAEDLRADRSSPEADALWRAEMRDVWAMVDRLPAAQRAAMTLRFRDDLSVRAIARLMNRSEPAVKQLIFRAVARLRSQLEVGRDDEISQLAHAMS